MGTRRFKTQQGDTFPIFLYYYEGSSATASMLPSGYRIVAVVYGYDGKPIKTYTTGGGGISTHVGYYEINVTHEDSMKMVGNVYIEVTVTDENNTVVDHAEGVVPFESAPRKNNNALDNDQD